MNDAEFEKRVQAAALREWEQKARKAQAEADTAEMCREQSEIILRWTREQVAQGKPPVLLPI